MEASLNSIRQKLGQEKDTFTEISLNKLERVIGNNHAIVEAVKNYNASVAGVNKTSQTIQSLQEKFKIKKELPVTEYLANFLQQR